MRKLMTNLFLILGVEQTSSSHHEKFLSALGGFISLFIVSIISLYFLGAHSYWLIVPSMAASAVLHFAVPHGQLSQPWPLIAGHTLSALIGVSFGLFFESQVIAISLAVGLSIWAMYYLKCVHPPGGATAFSAVLVTQSPHSLGYDFVLAPVLLNTLTIFTIAVFFNAFFKWRRYPAFFQQQPKQTELNTSDFTHDDYLYALKEIDSFVDVNEYDLHKLFELTKQHLLDLESLKSDNIKIGSYYNNGKSAVQEIIRQVVDEDLWTNQMVLKKSQIKTGMNTKSPKKIFQTGLLMRLKSNMANGNVKSTPLIYLTKFLTHLIVLTQTYQINTHCYKESKNDKKIATNNS